LPCARSPYGALRFQSSCPLHCWFARAWHMAGLPSFVLLLPDVISGAITAKK